ISLNKLGIERDGNVPEKPQNGWMLIGVNELYSRSGQYNWLQKYKPVDMIGYSIWIYKIEEIEEIIDSGTE
ncbi:MAG: hypothetical protein LBU65_15885, partial [Planctomycetaceae bacterium]|nr:hypothetical protein [Planctomycetaceae bacterium]